MSDAIIDGLRSALSNQLDNNKNLRAQLKMTQDARDGYRESVGRMSKELKAKDERIAAERKERDDWRKAYHAVAAQRTNAESQLTAEREKVAELEDRFNEQAICAEEFTKATSEVPMLKAENAKLREALGTIEKYPVQSHVTGLRNPQETARAALTSQPEGGEDE